LGIVEKEKKSREKKKAEREKLVAEISRPFEK